MSCAIASLTIGWSSTNITFFRTPFIISKLPLCSYCTLNIARGNAADDLGAGFGSAANAKIGPDHRGPVLHDPQSHPFMPRLLLRDPKAIVLHQQFDSTASALE